MGVLERGETMYWTEPVILEQVRVEVGEKVNVYGCAHLVGHAVDLDHGLGDLRGHREVARGARGGALGPVHDLLGRAPAHSRVQLRLLAHRILALYNVQVSVAAAIESDRERERYRLSSHAPAAARVCASTRPSRAETTCARDCARAGWSSPYAPGRASSRSSAPTSSRSIVPAIWQHYRPRCSYKHSYHTSHMIIESIRSRVLLRAMRCSRWSPCLEFASSPDPWWSYRAHTCNYQPINLSSNFVLFLSVGWCYSHIM